ncbi:MAG: hypothetical protein ACKON9_09415, partial [Planctomycetaceae bacterium]
MLRSELRLVIPESRTEAWREFCAMYLELRWFEPDLLKVWFPSLAESRFVDVLLDGDVAAAQLFERTRLYGATSPDLTTHLQRDEERLVSTRREWFLGIGSSPSDRAWLRASRRRERARERGNTVGASRIQELRRALQLAEPSAFLAEPRVIRRVIRERHGFVKLSTAIPHTDSQIVPASELRELVHPDELGLADFLSLPETCLLISQPAEDELQHWPIQELLQQVWRRLFHAVVDRELQQKLSGASERAEVQQRIARLGQVAFDEAHFVLRSELRLVIPESRTEAWREFCAMYLELR